MSGTFSRWADGRWRAVLLWLGAAAGLASAQPAPLGDSPLAAVARETAVAAAPARPEAGNRLLRLENGYDALLLRVHLIRAARRSIEIQTFIWTNDECGRLLTCELIEAARRGVKVRILADQMFSETDPATIAFLATADPNLEVKHYRPPFARIDPTFWQKALAGLRSFRGINQRMHNKVMIVDGAALITGGRNVENSYFDHGWEMNYRDRDVLAVGPVVAQAEASFEDYWAYRHAVPSRQLKDVAAVIERARFRRYERREDYDFGPHFGGLAREADDAALIAARFAAPLRPVAKVTFLADTPGKMRGWFSQTARITRELRRTLEGARREVLMQTPYLVLSPAARGVFRDLKARQPGLRVVISSNSFASTDNLLAYSANYRLRNLYIEDLGLEVHELKPEPAVMRELFPRRAEMAALAAPRIAAGEQKRGPFFCLHAKSLVIDEDVAFIGSYNLDPRSENLNTEVGLLVEDRDFARGLRAEIERDLRAENSWVIGRRELPLGLDKVNGLIGGIVALSPIELWPIRNTTSYELRTGAAEVPVTHPDFHKNYREAGSFPGSEGVLSTKEITTRLYKAVGTVLTPVL